MYTLPKINIKELESMFSKGVIMALAVGRELDSSKAGTIHLLIGQGMEVYKRYMDLIGGESDEGFCVQAELDVCVPYGIYDQIPVWPSITIKELREEPERVLAATISALLGVAAEVGVIYDEDGDAFEVTIIVDDPTIQRTPIISTQVRIRMSDIILHLRQEYIAQLEAEEGDLV